MGKLKINFKPIFLIYVFVCIYFGWYNDIFYYVLAVVLHEYGHYLVAKHYGYDSSGIVFNLYGAALNTNNCFQRKHDILISFAGPLVNVLLILILLSVWWVFPQVFLFSEGFLYANIVTLIFNLIPIYPLDGGRIFVAIISKQPRCVNRIFYLFCSIFWYFPGEVPIFFENTLEK